MRQGRQRKITSDIWHRDLLELRTFRAVAIVGVLLPALAFLISVMAIFSAIGAVIYLMLLFVAFKCYDFYEARKRSADDENWAEGMRRDGWEQKSANNWEMAVWDDGENRFIIYRYLTDAVPKPFITPRSRAGRHVSYIFQKRRIRPRHRLK